MATIFELQEFKPFRAQWDARQKEFKMRESYYDGSRYRNVHWLAAGLPVRLTQGIKPLFMPLARAVNVDAGIVPGGWTFAPGAEQFQVARDKVFSWSRWQTDGVLFVHYGALYGHSGLRVCDLRDKKEVWVKPISPLSFMLIEESMYDTTPDAALVVERRDNPRRAFGDGATFEYAEYITPDEIRTFADGKPAGFDGRADTYRNELGFVPFVECSHIVTGAKFADCAFSKAVALLDEINEMATDLAAVMKEQKDPQWAIIGAEQGDIERGQGAIWFLPPQSNVKVLTPLIDIGGALAFIDRMTKQLEKTLPELAFDEIISKGQIATATVELQLLELALLVRRVRPNYDDALVRALRMAGKAGKSMNLSEIAVLDDDMLAIDSERAVLPSDEASEIEIALKRVALAQAQRALEQDNSPDAGVKRAEVKHE